MAMMPAKPSRVTAVSEVLRAARIAQGDYPEHE
jgi:hypothetical protein